jgi:hypothetical protein
MANFLINNNFYQLTANPMTPVVGDIIYEPRAIFSISASNQLEGSFWITKNGQHLKTNLGSAEYLVRDANGITIGIIESGILADSNGFYQITPVGADAIQDLTHYVVELKISADNSIRNGVVGITLGE